MKTRIAFLFLLLPLAASTCNTVEPVLPGDLKRITDAIILPCKPYNFADKHSCVFFADEFNRVITAYDATDRQYVLAPLGYTPLAISNRDAAPARLAGMPDYPILFALDKANAAIDIFSTENSNNGRSPFGLFLHHLSLDDNDFGPTALEIIKDPLHENHLLILVTMVDRLLVIPFDTISKTEIGGGQQRIAKALPATPNDIAVLMTTPNTGLVAISQNANDIVVFKTEDLANDAASPAIPQYLAADGATDRLTLGNVTTATGPQVHVIALRANINEQVVYETLAIPMNTSQPAAGTPFVGKRLLLDSLPKTLFMPRSDIPACCKTKDGQSNTKEWIAILTATGVLQYIALPDFTLIAASDRGRSNLFRSKNLAGTALHPTAFVGGHIIAPDEATKKDIVGSSGIELWGQQMFLGFDGGAVGSVKQGGIDVQNLESIVTE